MKAKTKSSSKSKDWLMELSETEVKEFYNSVLERCAQWKDSSLVMKAEK